MLFDLSKIGQALRAAREERGFSLDDVSSALFIRKSLVSAMESGNWDILPHPVYVKGYITQYASFLNVLDRITPDLAPPKEGSPSPVETDRARKARPAKAKAPMEWGPPIKVMSGIAMLFVVIAFLVFQNVQNVQRPVHVATPNPTVAKNDQVPSNSYQSPANNNYQTVSAASPDNYGEKRVLDTKKLMIACQERTWVRVVIDDREKKEIMMNPEEVVVFNAREKFDLLIGNAAGVTLFYDGKDTGFTGDNGEVKRITLS